MLKHISSDFLCLFSLFHLKAFMQVFYFHCPRWKTSVTLHTCVGWIKTRSCLETRSERRCREVLKDVISKRLTLSCMYTSHNTSVGEASVWGIGGGTKWQTAPVSLWHCHHAALWVTPHDNDHRSRKMIFFFFHRGRCCGCGGDLQKGKCCSILINTYWCWLMCI